jgi:UPF0042 nucleotide-binding protein
MTSPSDPPERLLVIVTGLSGAGRSTALKALEDLGFEAIDNLPLGLLDPLLSQHDKGSRRIAVGIDVRTRDLVPAAVPDNLRTLAGQQGFALDLVFLECSDSVLLRRFSVTRRRHPLEEADALSASIARERILLQPLRTAASQIIETSELSPQDVKALLATRYARPDPQGLVLQVVSFSFKRGLPPAADMVFDLRFLRNPHYDPTLSEHTGLDSAVGAYIAADPLFHPFLMQLQDLLQACLEGWTREGKSYATLAFGCSGGKHRSVYTGEEIARWLRSGGWPVSVQHLEMSA